MKSVTGEKNEFQPWQTVTWGLFRDSYTECSCGITVLNVIVINCNQNIHNKCSYCTGKISVYFGTTGTASCLATTRPANTRIGICERQSLTTTKIWTNKSTVRILSYFDVLLLTIINDDWLAVMSTRREHSRPTPRPSHNAKDYDKK